MAGLNDYLLKNNFKNIEINEINPGIEDCFMALMK
jgi:hypothetical protein